MMDAGFHQLCSGQEEIQLKCICLNFLLKVFVPEIRAPF